MISEEEFIRRLLDLESFVPYFPVAGCVLSALQKLAVFKAKEVELPVSANYVLS